MADIAATAAGITQQFQQQIDFFRGKLNLPTERWDDIKQAAHDRAFIVAGAQKADLLADLRQAVDKSNSGGGIAQFRKDFADAVTKSGWTGWTGEDSDAGQAWRTRVIYRTNMATSYAAGRWQQLHDPDLLKARPYWRYIHSDGVVHPRPQHQAWNGLTLPHDHPFWQTHFPPNGWGCQCRVMAVRAPKEGDAAEPPQGWNGIDPKTGAPPGIDKGWDYAPGARADDTLRSFVQDKLISYPPAIGRALTRDVNRYIDAQTPAPDFVRHVLSDSRAQDMLWLGFVEDTQRIQKVTGIDARNYTVLLPADAARHVRASHGMDTGAQRPPQPDDYGRLMAVLNQADSLSSPDITGPNGEKRLLASKLIEGQTYQAVFEARTSKRNRALALVTLWIKLPGQ